MFGVKMAFETLNDLWSMGGQGTYVWLSYALSSAIIVYSIISPIMSYKKTINAIRMRNITEETIDL